MLYPQYKGVEPSCTYFDCVWSCIDERAKGFGHTPEQARSHWRCAFYDNLHGSADERLRALEKELKLYSL